MHWVGLDSKRLEKTLWYTIQYEFLPHFCFSCGLLGHLGNLCPTPSERDANGNLPWGPNLQAPNDKKKKKRGPPFTEGGYEEFPEYYEYDDFNEMDPGTEEAPLVPLPNSGRGRRGGLGAEEVSLVRCTVS